MPSPATTPEEYLNSLPAGRKKPMQDLRKVILENLPEGFTEEMAMACLPKWFRFSSTRTAIIANHLNPCHS